MKPTSIQKPVNEQLSGIISNSGKFVNENHDDFWFVNENLLEKLLNLANKQHLACYANNFK